MESLEEFLKADHQMTHLTKESTQPASLLALKMLKTSLKKHGLTPLTPALPGPTQIPWEMRSQFRIQSHTVSNNLGEASGTSFSPFPGLVFFACSLLPNLPHSLLSLGREKLRPEERYGELHLGVLALTSLGNGV